MILEALLKVKDAAVSVVVTILNKISDEPLVTIAAVGAGVNAVANGSSAWAYVAAGVVALARFAVSPVLPRIEE